ncbi:MAG: F-type H+-transporting ATPase subunit b [Verrucomicrobiales bacterium]|jgi:F-type H+-transporting ATPase subunit b
MLIDWFTVGAQVLNFVILVWLMKRFLYQPILNAIDAREKRIADELADADAQKAEASKERNEFQRKNEEFDKQRSALMSEATNEAAAERQRLLDVARKEADELSEKRRTAVLREEKALHQQLTQNTTQEVFAIARKALGDLADESLEQRMGEVFAQQIRDLNDESKANLRKVFTTSETPLLRSAFDLPPDQREVIQTAINETLSAAIQLRFETTPDLVSGIELSAGGQKVAWSIAHYLSSLEKSVGKLINA